MLELSEAAFKFVVDGGTTADEGLEPRPTPVERQASAAAATRRGSAARPR
jgi:hypothetical protein